ncbi:Apolipoprotein N-acyltransferase [Roseimaritima multifibrata]|uniref:Apolipoprotein N-acyltransferase n=1 Tax=Roseimaritima multifibrata TaxID=1930274 RepID=A0A517MBI0_9BACT|nr:apolipoprotein N-acyltransferase [Roseimaritima multifibrata]QDS92240.1 Apolipoprotein N-acyltransferase [Roseimaritima multifibrata]
MSSGSESPSPTPTPSSPDPRSRRLQKWLPWLGAVLLWLAMDPLRWWVFGWIALVPWSILALQTEGPGASGYRRLWYAGTLFWLTALYGLCFAHPAMFLGWLTLSAYLGLYTPLFVGLVRTGIANRIPPLVGIPLIWCGLEWIRGYAFTGFSACMLGHTQADITVVIQIADLLGSYAVSALLATVAATIAIVIQARFRFGAGTVAIPKRLVIGAVASSVVLVTATLAYGSWRLQQPESGPDAPSLGIRVALVQRDEAVKYIMPPGRETEIFDSYLDGSKAALAASDQTVDLVVWPESMFTRGFPWMLLEETAIVPADAGMTSSEFTNRVTVSAEQWQLNAGEVQRRMTAGSKQTVPPALLLGCGVIRFAERPHSYSGAVLVEERGRVSDWYGKRHLVMFGEYIPFTEWFPDVHTWIQMPRVSIGPAVKSLQCKDVNIVPNICFETAVESVPIGQIRSLLAEGENPDVIINLTNDAWFGGSPILGHHRRCSQFAAVATRRPVLMASNTGPTFWADGSGRVIDSLPKMTKGHLLVNPTRDSRWSLYQWWGDWPLRLCAGIVCYLAFQGGWRARRV